MVVLDQCTMEDHKSRELQFEIVTKHRAYQLQANNKEEKEEWKAALQKAIDSYQPEGTPNQGFTLTIKVPRIPKW
jgi:hypothetical protein